MFYYISERIFQMFQMSDGEWKAARFLILFVSCNKWLHS